MSKKKDVHNITLILKVFDFNYISNENCEKLSGLNPNNSEDIVKAVDLLVLKEFLIYPADVREELLGSLKKMLLNDNEYFVDVFDEIEMAFDDEVENKRNFMQVLLKELEPYAVPDK